MYFIFIIQTIGFQKKGETSSDAALRVFLAATSYKPDDFVIDMEPNVVSYDIPPLKKEITFYSAKLKGNKDPKLSNEYIVYSEGDWKLPLEAKQKLQIGAFDKYNGVMNWATGKAK